MRVGQTSTLGKCAARRQEKRTVDNMPKHSEKKKTFNYPGERKKKATRPGGPAGERITSFRKSSSGKKRKAGDEAASAVAQPRHHEERSDGEGREDAGIRNRASPSEKEKERPHKVLSEGRRW